MNTKTQQSASTALKHVALLIILAGMGYGIFRFTCDMDRIFAAQANSLGVQLGTWGKTWDGTVPTLAERRRLTMIKIAQVVAGGCALGFITVGAMRVIKSWRRMLV